jgi:hypothetical protein
LILYIPTAFKIYGRAITEVAAYPDVTYLELQQRILRLWQLNRQARLLYKTFSVAQDQGYVMADFIREHIPNAIVTNQRLTDLMWAVDAIVLDHVSTALVEVLLTHKPLVVYFPKPTTALPEAKSLLEKRAVVAETPEAFESAVRLLLGAGPYRDFESPNAEFLQAYGTHLNDGRSAERAADVILGHAGP